MRFQLAAMAAMCAISGVVHAQELHPPALEHFEPATPVADLDEPVQVLLELEIAEDGTVRAVRVIEGAGTPFDEAAQDAASRFRFRPATRDGTPVAARVRFRYAFTPTPSDALPSEAPPPEPSTSPPAPSSEETAAESEPFGVTAAVDAPEREAVTRDLEAAEVTRIAGAHGDLLRAVEVLPGVSAVSNQLAGGLAVRGSHPLDTQVMVEGAPSPIFNHVGGYNSFFNARLLERVALYPSNFSVRYGRSLGGIVEIEVRDRFRDGVHGGAEVNVIDGSVFVEGDAPEVSAAVAARRSWVDAIYGAVLGDDNLQAAPVYYDYQGIVRVRASPQDEVRLLVYGSHDNVAFDYDEPGRDPTFQGALRNMTQFHRGQLEWRHRYSGTVRQDVRLMVGHYGYSQRIGRLLEADAEGAELNGRAELNAAVAPGLTLTVGADLWGVALGVDYAGPPAPAPEGDPGGFGFEDAQVSASDSGIIARGALYAEARLVVFEGWTVVPGVRVDYIGDVHTWSPEPRISTTMVVAEGTQLRAGVGVFAQPPQLGRTLEGFGNPDLDPERAGHVMAGVRQRIGELFEVSLDGFYKHFWDRIERTPDGSAPFLLNRGVGRAYGGELGARWIGDRHLTAFLSYTLSRSERLRPEGGWREFDFDQTHNLNLAVGYDFGDGWEAGISFRVLTGTPYTPVVGSVYNSATDRYRPLYGELNRARNDTWYRLDLRLAKTFVIDGTGRIQISLDVLNVTNNLAQNGRFYSYDYRESLPAQGLPIIPNLGVRGEL